MHFDEHAPMMGLFCTLVVLVLLARPGLGAGPCPRRNCSFGLPDCAPRRCCGPPARPVLGGVDQVDLASCRGPDCRPRLGRPQWVSQPFGGPYRFLFRNDSNRRTFEAEPERFVPQAGGFCAFSMTGFDPNGVGLWCACATRNQGFWMHEGKLYFFLYGLAKDSFIRHGEQARINMERNWRELLAENNAKDLACFNTERIVPLGGNGSDDETDENGDDCGMMGCIKFLNCSDCTADV